MFRGVMAMTTFTINWPVEISRSTMSDHVPVPLACRAHTYTLTHVPQ